MKSYSWDKHPTIGKRWKQNSGSGEISKLKNEMPVCHTTGAVWLFGLNLFPRFFHFKDIFFLCR